MRTRSVLRIRSLAKMSVTLLPRHGGEQLRSHFPLELSLEMRRDYLKVKRFGISCCCKLVHFLILAGLSAAFEGEVRSQAWELVWSDEFDGPPNTAPDSTKWGYQLGGGGWGNRELEVYTNSLDNVFLDGNGNLVIKAIKGADGVYTSGR